MYAYGTIYENFNEVERKSHWRLMLQEKFERKETTKNNPQKEN